MTIISDELTSILTALSSNHPEVSQVIETYECNVGDYTITVKLMFLPLNQTYYVTWIRSDSEFWSVGHQSEYAIGAIDRAREQLSLCFLNAIERHC